MLSKKYRFIKQVLTIVSNVRFLHRKLIVLAKMYLDINRGYKFSYISDENGETDLLDALAGHYRDQFVFFDVGSHVGTYTDMVVERFENYQGHLFDISPDTLEFCIKTHGSNQNLTLNNLALSDTVGEVEYRFYPGTHMQNGISGVGPYIGYDFELRKAPCATGDHYCAEHGIQHIHLLKIDVEGYDLHALKGFDRMLSQANVDVIQFEYNIKCSETHSMLGDFYAYLEEKGYILGPLRQDGVVFRAFNFVHNDFESGPNYVACRPELRDILCMFKKTTS